MSLSVSKNSDSHDVIFSVADRAFRARSLYEIAAHICGGQFTTGYLAMLDLPISEFFFHKEVFEDVARAKAKAADAARK